MLSKFFGGLMFGAGFGIALAAVWTIWMMIIVPRAVESVVAPQTREPKFEKPSEPDLVKPDPRVPGGAREFSFFKHSGRRMEIPERGGILALAPMTTPRGAKRPSTYQLWLTESALWQIRTDEDKAQIEKIPRPDGAQVSDLHRIVREQLGRSAMQSTMTVSEHEIRALQTTGKGSRDETLNGKLNLTVDGVVFVLPNPYEQQGK